jgi:hypothetical protein
MQRPWPLAKANGFILKMGYERFYRLHTKREMTTEFVTGNPKQGKTQNAKPTVLMFWCGDIQLVLSQFASSDPTALPDRS